jgi:hypothetical protein
MKSEKFALQFDPALIPSLVNQYMMTAIGAKKTRPWKQQGSALLAANGHGRIWETSTGGSRLVLLAIFRVMRIRISIAPCGNGGKIKRD